MLVRPFIQPIKAFNAINGGIATLSILGGDIVTTVNYEIFSNGSLLYSNSLPVVDNGGATVRNFSISLTTTMGIMNNNSYTIRAYTQNATESSGYSSVQYFTCYVTPTVTLVDEHNVTITNSYQFGSENGVLTANFAKNDTNSPAQLNQISVNIYGINDGVRDLVYSSGETYSPFTINYSGLLPTGSTETYTSYTIDLSWATIEGMQGNTQISGVSCSYPINTSTGNISVENDCGNGRVKISFNSQPLSLIPTPFETGNIKAIAVDNENVYLVGQNSELVIYNKQAKTFTSKGLHIAIPSSIVVDENYVYISGSTSSGNGTFETYKKTTGRFVLVQNPFGSSAITALAIDNDNVYAGADNGKFAIYNKSTGTFGSLITNPNTFKIYAVTVDDNNVYIGGLAGQFSIYNKSTGTFGSLIPTPFSPYSIFSLATDEDSVYMGGGNSCFAIYDKATGLVSSLIEIPRASIIYSIVANYNDIYTFGTSGTCAIYNKQTGAFGESIPTASGIYAINSATKDNVNVYAAGDNGCFYIMPFRIIIQRKEYGNINSQFVTLLDKRYGVGDYFFYDYYCKSNAIYTYRYTSGDVIEEVQVLSYFNDAYIADGTTAFNITAEWDRNSFSHEQKSAIYEPYGRKYPVVAYNAVTNYRRGSDSCIVLSTSLITNRQNNYIDRIAQTAQQKAVNAFLTNRKVKVIKDFNGDIALICVLDVVGNSFVKELGNTLATTQFNWVEVGEFTDDDFKKLGITNSFNLIET